MAEPWLEPAPDLEDAPFDTSTFDDLDEPFTNEPPHPVNWNLLNPEEAEAEWIELNRWVNWLRRTYGLPASVVPPFWHRHPELVLERSALHLHWLCGFDPDQHGSAPFGWHRDFADARRNSERAGGDARVGSRTAASSLSTASSLEKNSPQATAPDQ